MGVGGVLQRGEGLVLFETLSEVLGAVSTNGIPLQTVRRSRIKVSGGADSSRRASGGGPDAGERRICLEGLAKRLCTLWSNLVA